MTDKNDVLDRLRKAKKELSESLEIKDKNNENIELIENQKSIEREDRIININKKLYKSDEKTERIVPKELKSNDGISNKRLAKIQRNIRDKVISRQKMTSKQKSLALIAIVLASMPLILLNTVSLVSCRFDFDNFGLYYKNTPGALIITIPVTNPTFVPAHLGEIELDIYDSSMSKNIASVSTNELKKIDPFATVVIDLVLRLDPETSGEWIKNMFSKVSVEESTGKVSGLSIEIYIRNFKYNGMVLSKEVILPKIDFSDMFSDLTSGLSINGLSSSNEKNINVWNEAQKTPTSSSSQDTSFELLNLDIKDSEETFELTLDIGMYLESIPNMYLGPINIYNMSTSLYGNHQNLGSGNREDYKSEIARLETLKPEELVYSNYKGVSRNTNSPIQINFGGMSYVGVKLTLFKDDIGSSLTHPSAHIDLSNETNLYNFIIENGTKYPMWNFFNNILSMSKIDALIESNNIDFQIFGVDILNLEIPKELLPVIQIEELFDINDLVNSSPIGIMGAINTYTKITTEGMLGLYDFNSNYNNDLKTAQSSFDLDSLSDMFKIKDFDTDMIKESWGENANLSLGLEIEINNELLDLYIGLCNVSLGISNIVEDYEATFAIAELYMTNTKSKNVYISGINSIAEITLGLTMMKNTKYAPFVSKFIRDLIENFDINAKASLQIDNLILFKQNYTFTGIDISIDLSGMLNLKGMIEDLIKDSVNGIFISDQESESENLEYINPMFYPLQLISKIMFSNPLISPFIDTKSINGDLTIIDDNNVEYPQSSQDLQNIEIMNVHGGTKITIDVANIEIDEGVLPIFLALGYTDLRIQAKNTYGGWEDMIQILHENYVEITDEKPFNVRAEIMLFEGNTLCKFINDILYSKNFDFKLTGYLSLNISGIWIPDINLNLEIESLNLGFNDDTMLNDLISGLLEENNNEFILIESQIQDNDPIKMWDGRFSTLLSSDDENTKGIDIENFLEIREVKITHITETGWPYIDSGNISIGINIELVSKVMPIEIHKLDAKLYDQNNNMLADVILNNKEIVYLSSGLTRVLELEINLIKSIELQNFLQDLISTFTIKGTASLTLSLKIFGCLIENLQANINLNDLNLNIVDLLNQMIPLSPQSFVNSPQASQDVIDLLGNFGISYLTTSSKLYNVGADNRNDPMFEVIAGMFMQPNFNISIINADLKLLDKTIYEAIYNNNPNNLYNAIEYSKIAQLYIDPTYCNNTYAPEALENFGKYGIPELPSGKMYWDVIDPNKPYYDVQNYNKSGAIGMRYAQKYNMNMEELYKSYSLGTFAMTEIRLSLFNQSHGSYRNAYPKEYWRSLGGPYFPVQVYGKSQGGYPDHRVVYHPHYSPIANLFSKLMNGMDDPSSILSEVTFSGNITLNVFSMDLMLDLSSPIISELVTTLLEETSVILKEGLYDATNPFSKYQDKTLKEMNIRNEVSNYYSNIPLSSDFTMDLNIDMESIIDDYPLISIEERNDHMFAPYLTMANYYKYMGNNIDPYTSKGTYKEDYSPGVYPFGDNIESFVKDYHYENYKLIVENWSKSKNRLNPFFESQYKNGTLIEDHKNWALRWSGGMGRTPSWAGMIIAGVVPAFEIGILSAFGTMWYDDPISGCDLVPMGYLWINSSIYPRPVSETYPNPVFGSDRYGMADDNGNVPKDSNWLVVNLRLFNARQTSSFFHTLLYNIEDMNLSFVLDISINASLFGYEIYNVGIGGLRIDDRSPFAIKCKGEFQYTEEGNIWGLPGSDGSIIPIEPRPEIPPEDMIPNYQEDTNIINIDGLFDDFEVSFGGIYSLGGSIRISLELNLNTPLPLPVWLLRLQGDVMIDKNETPNWENVTEWSYQMNIDSNNINTQLNRYEGENGNPYDFSINTIKKDSVKHGERIETPQIYLDIEWDTIGVLWDSIDVLSLLGGELKFTVDTLWMQIQNLYISVSFPIAFSLNSRINLNEATLTFDLVDLLDGTKVF